MLHLELDHWINMFRTMNSFTTIYKYQMQNAGNSKKIMATHLASGISHIPLNNDTGQNSHGDKLYSRNAVEYSTEFTNNIS